MKNYDINYPTIQSLELAERLATSNQSYYNIIHKRKKVLFSKLIAPNYLNEVFSKKPFKAAVLSGAIFYIAASLYLMASESNKMFLQLLLFTFTTSIVSGIYCHVNCIISLKDKKAEKYLSYIKKYAEIEETISESISDDPRLTKGVMMYRRDILDLIDSLRCDLGYKIDKLYCFNYSEKSKLQLQKAICCELSNINIQFEQSEIVDISCKAITFSFTDKEIFDSVIFSKELIEETLSVFGINPIFTLKKEV